MNQLDDLFETSSCESFTSNNSKIDRTGNYYHVTQQCYSFGNTFSLNSAKYRNHILQKTCEKNRVIVLCTVIMPNHTHDVLYSGEFANIQKTIRTVNTAVSKFISKERSSFGKKTKEPIFADLPAYEKISEKEHLFYLFKYLYDNPAYLKQQGKIVPYSCFDQWERAYYKPYKTEVYKYLFNKELSEITEMCINLSREKFRKEAEALFKGQLLKS